MNDHVNAVLYMKLMKTIAYVVVEVLEAGGIFFT
jgi:hypothetical protein